MKYQLEINKKKYDVTISSVSGSTAKVIVNGATYDVLLNNFPDVSSAPVKIADSLPSPTAEDIPAHAPKPSIPCQPLSSQTQGVPILAPIPGLILDIKVKTGEMLEINQPVAVIEAMKMENMIVTHVAGTVREILVQKNSEVSTRDIIMIIE